MESKRIESAPKISLATKLTRVVLFILLGVAVSTVAVVAVMNLSQAKRSLSQLESQIQGGLQTKGRGLTQNHALALRGMAYDNAFSDVESLIHQALREDGDLVYGLFLDSQQSAWTYVSPSAPLPNSQDTPAPKEIEPSKVDPNLWKELGFTPTQEDKLAIRNVSLFDQEIYEFAMPVIEEEEFLGSIRYGISTQRMHDELAAVRAESEKSIRNQLGVLIALGFFTTILGIILVRRQAIRVTMPLGELTTAANALASGDRSVHVVVKSGDEVELLAASFNQMVDELRISYENLEELNHGLELRVAERTEELDSKNRDMKKVFENVGQGFITLDRNATMALERSAVVDMWFGSYDQRCSFSDFMKQTSEKFSLQFDMGWESLTDGFLPVELCLEQLPRQLCIADQVFSIDYSAMASNEEDATEDDWLGVLVVISDITEQIAYEKAQAEQKDLANAIKSILSDRQGFIGFHSDTSRLVEEVTSGQQDDDMVLLKRSIHTIKGNTSIFGLKTLATLCSDMEVQMEETGESPDDASKSRLLTGWNSLNESISFLIGGNSSNNIDLSEEEYKNHLFQLRQLSSNTLYDNAFIWQLEEIVKPLERLALRAKQLASKMGKAIGVEVAAAPLHIDPKYWSPLWTEMVHVLRNAVDHGLSGLDEEKTGMILFAARQEDNQFHIEISDNGNGIDWTSIATTAERMGLPFSTQDDLEAALFHDGMSTRTQVTSLSGRGVGMSAVKKQVLDMGGTISIESSRQSGTLFRFSFPQTSMYGELYEKSSRTS